ncbi:MAG TPA: helix-turn-helix domain-containing protein [Anaeromyxobacter sp.]
MRLPAIPAGMNAKAWPPVLATRGPGWRGALHSHHSLHFVLAMEGELRVRTSAAGRWWSAAGVLTASDAPHAVDSEGVGMLVVFLDPESDAAATMRPALVRPVRPFSASERDALAREVLPRTVMRFSADEWVRNAAATLQVSIPPSQHMIHPQVRRLLAMLRAGGIDDATSLEALASAVGLSPSRLMHVFTASIGIPLRPYLAWLRLQRAATAIVNQSSLGDAAHAAGFADAAHMSRTFRRMLGVAPSSLRPMRCL